MLAPGEKSPSDIPTEPTFRNASPWYSAVLSYPSCNAFSAKEKASSLESGISVSRISSFSVSRRYRLLRGTFLWFLPGCFPEEKIQVASFPLSLPNVYIPADTA